MDRARLVLDSVRWFSLLTAMMSSAYMVDRFDKAAGK